ncbi:flagellar biosynthetic protein FliR [Geodermatophilus sp. YIM 151500]|uniref:flagellar biosynthetic protein FliR n=1 Tax=Geodermatophilus sp. YIM 151500 TaxID=2984531 RepID=UPI0021E44D95|nr:flagellar biosynthetic protein FliR [Geodermatophilus sp. YIM 151500]MCV2489509.1 flagellar biosynthetic protein FliR [Geodermatophilus sp. YIM 151500]
MDLQVPTVTLAALLLGTARATGFVVLAPPFNSRTIPVPVKGALALALSVALLTRIAPSLPEPTAGFLVVAAVTEAVIGAGLGFVVQLLFTAVQMAGDLIDVTGGFSLQPAYDPLAMTTNSSVGRLHYLLATTLLFTSGGHLLIVKGFATSYEGMPVGAPVPTDQLAEVMVTAFSMMFLAALQIAGPMVAVLLLADVALALLSRAAPALNIFAIGFPVKIMLTLALLGLTFPLLPPALDALLEQAARAMVALRSG